MIKQHHKRNPDGENIEQLALRIWRNHLFTHLNQKVSNAALRMLERYREGHLNESEKKIAKTGIEAVVKTYIDIGVLAATDQYDSLDGNLAVFI